MDIEPFELSCGCFLRVIDEGRQIDQGWCERHANIETVSEMARQKSAEQIIRDMLERMGVEDAQSFSSGDLIELANLVSERDRLAAIVRDLEKEIYEMRERARDLAVEHDLNT